MTLRIRSERPDEVDVIRDLTRRAFAPMPFADDNDPLIPQKLRAAGALTLSLIAEEEGCVIGHAAFSPARIGGRDGPWFALGPISVEIDRQKQGIGTALVTEGCARLLRVGAQAIVLIGNPRVYGPMGFVSPGNLTHGDLSPDYVMVRCLSGPQPRGEVAFHPAFDAT